MFSDKVFQIALLISVVTHGVLLFQNANLNLFSLDEKKEEKLEVRYVKETKKLPEKAKPLTARREPLLKIPTKLTLEKRTPPLFIDQGDMLKRNQELKQRKMDFTKPLLPKTEIIAIKKKITLPPIDINKINSPSYISLYQIVREKIKRAAYQNYTGDATGEVTITFIIANDGNLDDMRLIEEKSSPSSYLQEIALRSVRDATPFPRFPKELDYPYLSFNLVITFEVE